jgi:hypothetical protein
VVLLPIAIMEKRVLWPLCATSAYRLLAANTSGDTWESLK